MELHQEYNVVLRLMLHANTCYYIAAIHWTQTDICMNKARKC